MYCQQQQQQKVITDKQASDFCLYTNHSLAIGQRRVKLSWAGSCCLQPNLQSSGRHSSSAQGHEMKTTTTKIKRMEHKVWPSKTKDLTSQQKRDEH